MKFIILIAIAGLILLAAKWALIPSHRLPRHRVRHLRIRLRLRLHPGRGHATVFELWLRWGRFAAFRRSRRSRRSMTFWQRAIAPASEYSITVGRGHYRHRLRLPLEEHAVVKSPPRQGKTGWLARIILRYPGPVLSTTTKHDVFELTSGLRAWRGPVLVFNPQGVGGVPSTFRWNPLDGCQDPQVAIRRADAFAQAVSMKGVEEGSFWSQKASDYLRAYMHAAAVAGLDFRHIVRWVMGIDATEAEDILLSIAGPSQQWAAQLAELRGDANKTAQTIRMTMSRAMAFLTDPLIARSVLPAPGHGLDIRSFLRESGTLYLIAEAQNEDSPVAPLFACLANEIRYEAALMGSRMPGGRLDPPLLMALDEVTQICPVPVPSWLADSGGKGIQIITVAHGEAQLRSRWGKDGARVILDTSGAKIWLPGVSDPETLEMASKLCGTTGLKEARNWFGRRHDYHDVYARHPVMTPEMIRQLPDGCALVVRGGMSPVIARLPMAWKDPAYKKARRRGEAIAAVAAVPERAVQPTATPVPSTTLHLGHDGPAAEPDNQPPIAAGVIIKPDSARRANGNGAQQWPWQ
jgi:type IV secretion system protein VirD4